MTNILITGASSGLGAALARGYAAAGNHLALWGRHAERLDAIASECRVRGATAVVTCLDLRDIAAMTLQIAALDAQAPIELAIFNAGLGGSLARGQLLETPERTFEVATVNFTATVVGATAIAEPMARRGAGQIVIIGSIAESFPLPMAPTYSGAKAGLAIFAEALELRLAKRGVRVTLVSPGFIDTPMSRQVTEPKPFLMTAEAAAAAIMKALAKQSRRLTIPRVFGVFRVIALTVPRAMRRAVLRRL